ncbi:uncharacterized protein LOC132388993 [Hypanus sabinus]|uniref:uncharacterized protein LOC132388993 n=1 Tax=Hypanus sabinus TaxID=79690 RepID=UPI0028C49BF7|nr:uncharacterized protein LOC132388993 [Hypanus sabinus]
MSAPTPGVQAGVPGATCREVQARDGVESRRGKKTRKKSKHVKKSAPETAELTPICPEVEGETRGSVRLDGAIGAERESLATGELPLSWRRAVVVLLPKKCDLRLLKNRRPVSLLCADYKIFARAMANRLGSVLRQTLTRGLNWTILNCTVTHTTEKQPIQSTTSMLTFDTNLVAQLSVCVSVSTGTLRHGNRGYLVNPPMCITARGNSPRPHIAARRYQERKAGVVAGKMQVFVSLAAGGEVSSDRDQSNVASSGFSFHSWWRQGHCGQHGPLGAATETHNVPNTQQRISGLRAHSRQPALCSRPSVSHDTPVFQARGKAAGQAENLATKLQAEASTASTRPAAQESRVITRMKDWLLSLNLLIMCVQAVAGEPLEVVGMMGKHVSLPCAHRDEKRTLQTKTVLWQRGKTVVHIQNSTGGQAKEQDDRYNGRTEMDGQEFSQGNNSLTLKLLQLEDEGCYMCIVLTNSKHWEVQYSANIQLYVAANFSTPTIVGPNPERVQPGDLVNLTCHSSGGYPKPTVNWTDGENRPLLGTRQDDFSQDGVLRLWNISSMIQVKVTAKSSFACTVVNTRTNRSTTSPAWSGSIEENPVQQRNILLYVTLLVITLAMLVALGLARRRMTRRAEMTVTVACPEAHQMISTRNKTVLLDHSPC